MKYVRLGKSALNVSRICMGCMGFGNAATGQHSWTVDETQTREIIKHGLERGINFYDTAIVYQNGTSEKFVGQALQDFAKRDDYVIATKFTPRTQDEIDTGVSVQQHIENYLNQSLINLGMDYVDLYIGRLVLREDYCIATLNCDGEDFATACLRADLRYHQISTSQEVGGGDRSAAVREERRVHRVPGEEAARQRAFDSQAEH